MDSTPKKVGATTPAKEKSSRSKSNKALTYSENVNPNESSSELKFSKSQSILQSERRAKKSASKNPKLSTVVLASPSPKKKIRERKFVVAKKKLRGEELTTAVSCEKCKKVIGRSKCMCVAYENLRASQEEFFKNRGEIEDEVSEKLNEFDVVSEKTGAEPEMGTACERKIGGDNALSEVNCENNADGDEPKVNSEMALKRSRERLLEEARRSVSVLGSGRVMHLVKEFEKLSVFKSDDSEEKEEEEVKDVDNKSLKWELPGLQQPHKYSESQVSSTSFSPSDFFLTSESLGLDSRRSHSLDSSQGSISSMTSSGTERTRRESTDSLGNRARRHRNKKQLKATSQKPFMLRTEERGRYKEEEFMKRLQKMLEEEEKMRIPIAQGLPWTTDEPECLVKPLIKESTRPVDLVLHSDVRAVERSEFDHQVAQKINFIEHYRMERERQQKLEEEEEIRRLRKELIPKAHPMPYFDRPFIPQRSMKPPTVPKEPKFHVPQHKKIRCNWSLDGFWAHSNSSTE